MKNLILNEKALRKRMIDRNVRSINELAAGSGVSKPTIYEYLNGKSPFSATFVRLCDYLNVNPQEVLTEIEEVSQEERDV